MIYDVDVSNCTGKFKYIRSAILAHEDAPVCRSGPDLQKLTAFCRWLISSAPIPSPHEQPTGSQMLLKHTVCHCLAMTQQVHNLYGNSLHQDIVTRCPRCMTSPPHLRRRLGGHV